MSKVLVAMSGGVDSTAAALLLSRAGHTCAGGTMKLFSRTQDGFCCDTPYERAEFADAERACERLGIPWELYDLRPEFLRDVLGRFARAYEEGATPNPCVLCNRYLKFGAMLALARERGFDALATGHYARIAREGGRYYLKRALDPGKDQTYFLYHLEPEDLAHILFPLGELSKAEVREIAQDGGMENARKKDSQDICFVPDGDYAGAVCAITGKNYPHGNFVGTDGRVLGEHKGIVRYTVGQRRGLGLALPAPLYVCQKRTETNEVVLCPDEQLYTRELDAADFHWLVPPVRRVRAQVKLRSTGAPQDATVTALGDRRVHITFDTAQRAAARGQAVVAYDGDYVLGGGTIE